MRLVTTTADLKAYYTDKSIAAPLNGMDKTGFKHIDLSISGVMYKDSPWIQKGDKWKFEVEDCLKIAEEKGFDFCQAHSPYINSFENDEKTEALTVAIRNSIEACKMLSIPHTVVHPIALYGATPNEFLNKNIEYYRQFTDDTEKNNVDILMENSSSKWNPQCYIRTGKELREFVEKSDMPHMHICWDTGHGNVQGQNQIDDIVAMGSELKALHIHDNYGNEDSHTMPLIGTTNFDNVVKGLLKIGYGGDFTFEACATLRRVNAWPNYRRDIKDSDLLSNPPLYIVQKQQALMYEVGKWMLESYNIKVE